MHLVVVFLASLIAILLEVVTRKGYFPTWLSGYYFFIPLSVLLSYLLYTAFGNKAEGYLAVWVLFYTLNVMMRTACSVGLLGEELTPNIIIGISLVMLGAYLVRN